MSQAKSFMQAAKTVKDSDTSYNGWSAAAAQYRKAAAAFQAAGDLAQAAVAAEQAQTLENALKIANQQAAQATNQPAGSVTPPQQQQQQQQQQQADPAQPAPSQQQSADCSTITGLGGDSAGPTNCTSSSGTLANLQPPMAQPQPQARPAVLPPPRVTVFRVPECSMCDVLKTVGEVVPDLAEKLESIRPEAINDVEPVIFDGGPNTLHPFLPRSPLAPTSAPQDPLDAINDFKDIADDAKSLSELTEKNKEPEDYAEQCRDGFLDAAWKAFTASDGNYREKAKAAKDSLKKCIHASVKHIEKTLANGGVDPDLSLEDN